MWYQKRRILISDDSHAYLMYLTIQLKKMGFEVTTTTDGLSLIKSVKEQKPDLVLLDINMSEIDGVSALRFIKESADTRHVPVVMISANAAQETKALCFRFGCSEYLVKPVSIGALHEMLEKCIYAPQGYRRRNKRILFQGRVTVTTGEASHELRTETLSERGVYVCAKQPLAVGTRVRVGLPLDIKKELLLEGRVIYRNLDSSETSLPSGMAVEFTETDQDKLDIVTNYVNGLLTIPTYTTSFLERELK